MDDDELTRYVVAKRLRQWGYDPVVFDVPRDALHYLKNGSTSALITDMYMPDTTGLALARAVRLVSPDMPIVLMTGSPDPHLYQSARVNGILEVVIKKAGSHEDLRVALRRALIRGRDGMNGSEPGLADAELAHSLRTPLAALKSAVETLGDAGLPAPQQDLVDAARRNLDRMILLVARILDRNSVRH